jgi:hypothetical protein
LLLLRSRLSLLLEMWVFNIVKQVCDMPNRT